MKTPDPIESFITRWQAAGGSERANYQIFLTELCDLLELPKPDPAHQDTMDNAYVFERRVTFHHGDGSESNGFIDLYKRGAFVCEAKKIKGVSETGFDKALASARGQAEQYARALPAHEGRPPFLIVVDVGNVIELYSEFTRSGATYTPFPDPRSYRLKLDDLRLETTRERLRQVWLDPIALDPTRQSARVTREIAVRIAEIAKSLEGAGYGAEEVAGFLSRCLFTFFAEDIGLLPKRAFADLLESLADKPQQFIPLLTELWKAMDSGEFSTAIREKVIRFNGKLFKQPVVLPLDRDQIGLLITAAHADWRQVEPAIFGTLLERALDPEERHALGAHYTPRSYVERLVLPTIIEPLREDWRVAQAAALTHATEGEMKSAWETVRDFHKRLCAIRVLDPACGSGNFLYVTLEHLKRLEGEILNQLEELGDKQGLLDLAGVTVDPHQFLGIELNPRAAAVAEMVLWIGYLQWHFRTRGSVMPPLPVLRDFHNIQHRDALLVYDKVEPVLDEQGNPVTRWDGRTFKMDLVTGEQVPDESVRLPSERYVNPRKAEWPEADFAVGNPPFIGAGPMRAALGDGYVEALRETWRGVPESADFVMFWWYHAAELTRAGKLRRFGFITTNSLRQTFNRRVVKEQMAEKIPLALVFAIPDHPWVDAAGGAAVRIAMTVGAAGAQPGRLLTVTDERESGGEGLEVTLDERRGTIHADLRIGANVAAAMALRANENISTPGFKLHGAGFIVTPEEAAHLDANAPIRIYRNGKDLTNRPRGVKVIDLFGFTAEEVRSQFPATFQWVLERVKPERDNNKREGRRLNWWLFGEPNPNLRQSLANLNRYVATVETSKHRVFQFLESSIAPDNMLVCIALDDAVALGVLSSRVHVEWALAAGGRLGVGNDPRYNKTRCFEPFPFPVVSPELQTRIRGLAEQLDAHRKKQQALHDDITITGMYNVLEKIRAGETLTTKDKAIHENSLVGILKNLHDELDVAVLAAYGWSDLAPRLNDPKQAEALKEILLGRLVALNAERAAEEQRGLIRYLRPDFQNPQGKSSRPEHKQPEMALRTEETKKPARAAISERQPWPKKIPAQVKAVDALLAGATAPLTEEAVAARFTGRGPWKKRLPMILDMLVIVGRVRKTPQGFRATS